LPVSRRQVSSCFLRTGARFSGAHSSNDGIARVVNGLEDDPQAVILSPGFQGQSPWLSIERTPRKRADTPEGTHDCGASVAVGREMEGLTPLFNWPPGPGRHQ
jgi:hypothetical protein